MTDERSGEFRLRSQHHDRAHFGHVHVRSVVRRTGPTVSWAVDPRDGTSLQPRSDPDCMRAVLDGVAVGLELVRRCGHDTAGLGVDVTRCPFTIVDDSETAYAAAAALAVADAWGLLSRMGLRYDDPRWTPHPIRVPGAGEMVGALLRDVSAHGVVVDLAVAAMCGRQLPRTITTGCVELQVDGQVVTARGPAGASDERVALYDLAPALLARWQVAHAAENPMTFASIAWASWGTQVSSDGQEVCGDG